MTEAMRLEGAFKGWNEKNRNELLIECAQLAQSDSAMLAVSEMDRNDFLSLSQRQRDRLKNPVYCGFESCIRQLTQEFKTHDLHVWYDDSQEYAETCLKLYQRLKNTSTDLARRLPSITFADDRKYPGLQAADMVTYTAYTCHRDGDSTDKIIKEIHNIFWRETHGRTHLLYKKGAVLGDGILEA